MIGVRTRRFTARARSFCGAERGVGREAKAARIRANKALAARFMPAIATAARAQRNPPIVK